MPSQMSNEPAVRMRTGKFLIQNQAFIAFEKKI
jgi:hypothetical protein